MMPNTPYCDVALQPPGALRTLAALTQLIEQGWQIEPPVLVRLAWAQRHGGELAYHIILERAARRSLVVLPATPLVYRFLSEQRPDLFDKTSLPPL